MDECRVKNAIDNTIDQLKLLQDDLGYETKEDAIRFELKSYFVGLIMEITKEKQLSDPVLDNLRDLTELICDSSRYTGYGDNEEHDRHPTSNRIKGNEIIQKIGKFYNKKRK